jgi:hypothetical protein
MSVVPPKAVVKSGNGVRHDCGLMVSPRTGCHVMPNARRFPLSWTNQREDDACFIVRDNNGQGAPAGPSFQQFPRRWILRRCRRTSAIDRRFGQRSGGWTLAAMRRRGEQIEARQLSRAQCEVRSEFRQPLERVASCATMRTAPPSRAPGKPAPTTGPGTETERRLRSIAALFGHWLLPNELKIWAEVASRGITKLPTTSVSQAPPTPQDG